MPITDSGEHKCENKNCKRYFKWVHFEMPRHRVDDPRSIAVEIPNEPKTYTYEKQDDQIHITVNCPHCGYENSFYKDIEKN